MPKRSRHNVQTLCNLRLVAPTSHNSDTMKSPLPAIRSWFLPAEPDLVELRGQVLNRHLVRSTVMALGLIVVVSLLAAAKLAPGVLTPAVLVAGLLVLTRAMLVRRGRLTYPDRSGKLVRNERQVAGLTLLIYGYIGTLIAHPGPVEPANQIVLLLIGLLAPLALLRTLSASRLVFLAGALPMLAGSAYAMLVLSDSVQPVIWIGFVAALVLVAELSLRGLSYADQAIRSQSRERSLLSQQLALFSTSQLGIAQTLSGRIGRANARFRQWFGEGAGDALLNDLATSIGMSRDRLLRLINRADQRIAGHESRSINVLLNGATPRYFSVQVRRFDPIQPARGLLWTVSDQTSDWLSRKANERAATRDPLTGALNRRALHKRLSAMLIRDLRRQPFAVLCIDINRFGELNSANGEGFGDQILCIVYRRLQRILREQDVIARTGGNEFVIVLDNVNGMERAASIAEKVMESLSAPIVLTSMTCSIAAAVGVAVAPLHGRRSDELLSRARASMFAVKRTLVQVQAGKLGRRAP